MSYDEFWRQDCTLVKYYRKAEQLRADRKDMELWLQGMYIYEATTVSLSQAFDKRSKARYPDKPYHEKAKEDAEKIQMEKNRQYLEDFATKFNRKFGGEQT